jgi:hypothetical protein
MSAVNDGAPPIDRLLSHLESVRETASAQYVAKCPAHDDGSPSLSIRDLGDRVLIHCFAGCDPGEVMDAAGLSLADLFVRRETHGPTPRRERWNTGALLRELSDESVLVLIAATDMVQNRPLPPDDYKRLRTAVDRIARIVEIAV